MGFEGDDLQQGPRLDTDGQRLLMPTVALYPDVGLQGCAALNACQLALYQWLQHLRLDIGHQVIGHRRPTQTLPVIVELRGRYLRNVLRGRCEPGFRTVLQLAQRFVLSFAYVDGLARKLVGQFVPRLLDGAGVDAYRLAETIGLQQGLQTLRAGRSLLASTVVTSICNRSACWFNDNDVPDSLRQRRICSSSQPSGALCPTSCAAI